MAAPPPSATCHVCGDAAGVGDSALCNSCGKRFHLRLRHDIEGKDRGEVWINEQFLSLEFACFSCLDRGDAASQEPPVASSH